MDTFASRASVESSDIRELLMIHIVLVHEGARCDGSGLARSRLPQAPAPAKASAAQGSADWTPARSSGIGPTPLHSAPAARA